jgi:hypothetical protein
VSAHNAHQINSTKQDNRTRVHAIAPVPPHAHVRLSSRINGRGSASIAVAQLIVGEIHAPSVLVLAALIVLATLASAAAQGQPFPL